MTDARNLLRWSGLMLATAGALYVPLPFISDWTRIEDIGGSNWWAAYYMATIHHFLLLFGLFGLFIVQLRAAGRLGVIAFVTASLGNMLVGGVGIVQITILPMLAANPDVQPMLICTPFYTPATLAAEGFIASACAAWNFDVLGMWVDVSWLSLALGSIALGVAIARAGILPRTAGLALVFGWLWSAAGLLAPVPDNVANFGIAIVGAAYVVCGWAICVRPAKT
jgi:hypothetical protein